MAAKNADPIATSAQCAASFINRMLIGHPCMVLRRQCQIHAFAKRSHLTPFTLIPAVGHIISKDGVVTLWKGSIGYGVLWTLKQVAEIVISDIFNLPKHVIPDGSSERFWRHVLLKVGTYFVMTPFIVASFVETVRSNTGFSPAEDARVLDVIVRGIDRLRFDFFGARDSSRRFSVAYLSIPTVTYFTSHFLVAKFTYDIVYGMARRYVSRKMQHERTRFHSIMPEMFAAMTSNLVADLICYPFETILHRLYIQGTRTLIDNLDTGVSAISVSMKYSGFFDCLTSIVRREGFSRLYMGVGAVVLQYSLQFCVLNTVRAIFNHGSNMALHVQTTTSPRGVHHGFGTASGPLGSGTTYTTGLPSDVMLTGANLFDAAPGWADIGVTAAGKLSPILTSGAANTFGAAGSGGYFDTNKQSLSGNVSPPLYPSLLLQSRDASAQNLFPSGSMSPPFAYDPSAK